MYESVSPLHVSEVLARLFALFRKAPPEISIRLNRAGSELSPDLLSNLRQFGSTPTPRQLQALKSRLSMTTGGAFRLFGYNLDRMRAVEGELNGWRTRFIETYPFDRDMRVDLPQTLGEDRAFQSTSYLSDLVLRWQEQIPIRSLRGPHWQKDGLVYAQLGTSDRRALPRIPPGSFVAISPIREQERKNPDPERFYFLQHGEGYVCSKCLVRQRRLSLLGEDHSDPGPYEFFYPEEVRIVGRVVAFGASLSPPRTHVPPSRHSHRPAPLILPWEHRSLRDLVSAERRRFGIGDAHVARASEILEASLGSTVSSRTMRRYEHGTEGVPRTAVLLSLALMHSLRFTDVLRILNLWTDESQHHSLSSLLNADTFDDLPETFPTASIPRPIPRWTAILEEWGEWPTLLSMAMPNLRQWGSRVLRIRQSDSYKGIDPLIAPGSMIVLDESSTSPPSQSQRPLHPWCRSIYALRSEGRTLCGYVVTDEGKFVLLPHPAAATTPREAFRRHRTDILGQVVAVASPLS